MASPDARNNEIGDPVAVEVSLSAEHAPLCSDTVLYRSLTRAGMYLKETVHPGTGNAFTPLAFMRRAPNRETGQKRDAQGFSVTLANGRSRSDVVETEKAYKPKAICSLLVADVEAASGTIVRGEPVSLQVVQDRPDHANIVGLPEVIEEPPTTAEARNAYADAELLGGVLAARAVLVWQK